MKYNIVKKFVKERMYTLGIEEDIDSMDSMTLDGLPESNIVTIVESYCSMKNQGLDDYSIFQNIENHRSSFDPYPNPNPFPTNPTLNDYIYFRLDFELQTDAGFRIGENGFTKVYIDKIIKESLTSLGGSGSSYSNSGCMLIIVPFIIFYFLS